MKKLIILIAIAIAILATSCTPRQVVDSVRTATEIADIIVSK